MRKSIISALFCVFAFGLNAQELKKLKESEVPSVVLNTFKNEYPHANDVRWELNEGNYEAEYHESRAALISPSGDLLADKNEIRVKNLPEAILNYFTDKSNNETPIMAERVIYKDATVSFVVVSNKNIYKFDPKAKVLSKDPIK